MNTAALDSDITDPSEISLDELIPLREAAALVPRRRAGRKCSVQCLYRWTTSGCRGLRLRYTQAGSTRCTSRRWLSEFFAALAAQSEAGIGSSEASSVPARRSPAARRRQIAQAQCTAKARGLL